MLPNYYQESELSTINQREQHYPTILSPPYTIDILAFGFLLADKKFCVYTMLAGG